MHARCQEHMFMYPMRTHTGMFMYMYMCMYVYACTQLRMDAQMDMIM